jgi:hypothetical protein
MRGDPPTERQLRRDEAGYTGGLLEWPGYEDGLRLLGGSASSPDPFFNHGRAESLSETTPRELTTEDTESTEGEVL